MNHDEYTDYSCSTSMERLARDVESALRRWHVTKSDRHVSFSRTYNNPQRQDDSPSRGMLKRSSSEGRGLSSPPSRRSDGNIMTRSRTSPSRGLSRSSSFRPSRVVANKNEVRLIRSETVIWTASLANGAKVSIPLTLALWDGPSSNSNKSNSDLAYSLQRLPFTNMPDDIFSNFSTLFGIGQHISLSPQEISNDMATSLATISVLQRHYKTMAPWIVSSILSSSLQTALNVAVSNVQSQLPVFGVWGVYSPGSDFLQMQHLRLQFFPSWMSRSSTLPHQGRARRLFAKSKTSQNHLNRDYIPPFLSGNLLPAGGMELDSPAATFWVTLLPGKESESRLSTYGQILLRHSPSGTTSVVLCGARHFYTWHKQCMTKFPRATSALLRNCTTNQIREWRDGNTTTTTSEHDVMDEPAESVDTYRKQCRRYAEGLLEAASGATATLPRWGPLDDPVASIQVTCTWNGQTNEGTVVEPLISLPFVVRSRHKMTRSDWTDMEDSVEQTLLDPFHPSLFVVQTHYDRDTSVTPLAASQRCILAALIRTATLPPEILMQHLTKEAVMDAWNTEMGEQAAKELVELANLHPLTKQLVEAMDWTSIGDDMIESWEAEQIVETVFDGSLVLGFPSPPEESFVATDDNPGPFAPFPKSAPPGRLLSLLFLNMSRLHAPSSMALVWKHFVNELRARWDIREALPNMSYVPGLDPSPEDLNVMRCVTTIGLKADNAAFVNCSEPDPDDTNCLIGQKLQVSSSCVGLSLLKRLRVLLTLHLAVCQPGIQYWNRKYCGA